MSIRTLTVSQMTMTAMAISMTSTFSAARSHIPVPTHFLTLPRNRDSQRSLVQHPAAVTVSFPTSLTHMDAALIIPVS